MARAWSKFQSMELTDDEKLDSIAPIPMPDLPSYPPGLRICLTQDELGKLDLDDDCEVGDMIDLRALGRVTSVSMNDGLTGRCCRVEIQIEEIALEIEDLEDPSE